eukprot:5270252-Pyramimonas_sp.AAC.1
MAAEYAEHPDNRDSIWPTSSATSARNLAFSRAFLPLSCISGGSRLLSCARGGRPCKKLTDGVSTTCSPTTCGTSTLFPKP